MAIIFQESLGYWFLYVLHVYSKCTFACLVWPSQNLTSPIACYDHDMTCMMIHCNCQQIQLSVFCIVLLHNYSVFCKDNFKHKLVLFRHKDQARKLGIEKYHNLASIRCVCLMFHHYLQVRMNNIQQLSNTDFNALALF